VRDEGATYAQRLKDAGVGVEYVCMKGIGHDFTLLDEFLDTGKEWNRMAVGFLKGAFGGTSIKDS